MIAKIKKAWRYSALRFYFLNTLWNYKFWLNCSKEYTIIKYLKRHEYYSSKYEVERKRFLGYKYKGQIFLDNPGFPVKDRDVWEQWRKKNLI